MKISENSDKFRVSTASSIESLFSVALVGVVKRLHDGERISGIAAGPFQKRIIIIFFFQNTNCAQ